MVSDYEQNLDMIGNRDWGLVISYDQVLNEKNTLGNATAQSILLLEANFCRVFRISLNQAGTQQGFNNLAYLVNNQMAVNRTTGVQGDVATPYDGWVGDGIFGYADIAYAMEQAKRLLPIMQV